ncbi:methyl-accepting chemotaxis protein [Acidocella sp.]|uniref:methyl-accepting chemotaxis protein n=1 Tax=Acidocella sp. TaxID=50710 RepID=UPI003CFDC92E
MAAAAKRLAVPSLRTNMKNLPIIAKILAILGVLGAFMMVSTGMLSIQMSRIAKHGTEINGSDVQAAFNMAEANAALQKEQAGLEALMISVDGRLNAQHDQEMKNAAETFSQEMSLAAKLAPDQADEIHDLLVRSNEVFGKACLKARDLAINATDIMGNAQAQSEFNMNCAPLLPPLTKAVLTQSQKLQNIAALKVKGLEKQAIRIVWISGGLVFLVLMIVILVAFFVIRGGIVRPLTALRDAMTRLSGGDLSTDVPESDRKDEIGEMSRAVSLFKEAGLEKQRVEEVARRNAAQVEAERAREQSAREAAAAVQAHVVQTLANGLERLSDGDLIFRIKDEFASEYEKLRKDFNKAVETLQSTLQQISTNAQGVRASAGEITQSSDDLSHRTEQQAANLEETAAALDEITVTVRKSSEGASEASQLVDEAKSDAERSGSVVNETVTAMGEIEASSKKISNIIGVIDEIAFQTNLLALNAGVEAARAGDAGRGFAVVATEVRALAQRSADAAKEIKALINASGLQVQTGVRLVNETGQALTRIVEQVSRLNILVTDMASSTKEQSMALAGVNDAVNRMDQVTQQNAAMVEQSTAASHALANEADELARLVGQFRIGEGMPQAKPAVTKSAKQETIQKVVPMPNNAVSPGKFKKVMPVEADDWDEF